MPDAAPLNDAVALLEEHYRAFHTARPFAERTGHTVPSDTKSYSEILVSLLTGIGGRKRQKGTDLDDGSDVKAANVWSAIDTPRFNGCVPAGRTTEASRKPDDVSAVDDTPYIFFVLWDERRPQNVPRCRVWCVRPQHDKEFRRVVSAWYEGRAAGDIRSTNFQLHPPRNEDSDVIRSSFGNLSYPLLFLAERQDDSWKVTHFDEKVLTSGQCQRA